jgi:hypothetical protein
MRILRYRLGAFLLRPHVIALIEHYNEAAKQEDKARAERCTYMGIGLRYAIGISTSWKKPLPR